MLRTQLILLFFISVAINSINACPSGWYQSVINGEKCYFVAQEKMNWTSAEYYCQNLWKNSHLTSILSAYETSEIGLSTKNSSIGYLDQVWIGARGFNQDLRFAWVDNSPFVYTNWQTGEPNLYYPCVSATVRLSGRWQTEPCENINYFICKATIPVEMTTISTTKVPSTLPSIICPQSMYPQFVFTSSAATMTDCYDWRTIGGATTDGIYNISPPGTAAFDVWCDMTTDGGGWTVFQKRVDNCTLFWNRTWVDYRNGFNDGMDRNYWLGLDRIHLLSTKDASNTLRIDIFGNRCNKFYVYACDSEYGPDVYLYGAWNSFSEDELQIDNEMSNYRLHVAAYIDGNITNNDHDVLHTSNNNQSFSTVDNNNQINKNENCAIYNNWGAWWYGRGDDGLCSYYCLNGKYYPDDDGIDGTGPKGLWTYHSGTDSSGFVIPTRTEIKFRKNVV